MKYLVLCFIAGIAFVALVAFICAYFLRIGRDTKATAPISSQSKDAERLPGSPLAGNATRVVFAALATPTIWAVAFGVMLYRPEKLKLIETPSHGLPTAPQPPPMAPPLYTISMLFCVWFFVFFLPVAIGLLRRRNGTFRNLCIAGACAGALPSAVFMVFFIGMGVHGGIILLPAAGYLLGSVCIGAALGAGVAATFGVLGGRNAA